MTEPINPRTPAPFTAGGDYDRVVAEHVGYLVRALTAMHELASGSGDLIDHVDPPEDAATPEFMSATTMLVWFLVGGVAYHSGDDVPTILRNLGAWASRLPEA